jgi:hypothetical protein
MALPDDAANATPATVAAKAHQQLLRNRFM